MVTTNDDGRFAIQLSRVNKTPAAVTNDGRYSRTKNIYNNNNARQLQIWPRWRHRHFTRPVTGCRRQRQNAREQVTKAVNDLTKPDTNYNNWSQFWFQRSNSMQNTKCKAGLRLVELSTLCEGDMLHEYRNEATFRLDILPRMKLEIKRYCCRTVVITTTKQRKQQSTTCNITWQREICCKKLCETLLLGFLRHIQLQPGCGFSSETMFE